MTDRIITSILDTDLYKFSTQCAFYSMFDRHLSAHYKFYDRDTGRGYYDGIGRDIQQQLAYLADLSLSKDDIDYLDGLDLYPDGYLQYLRTFRYNPDLVVIVNQYNRLDISIVGPLVEATMFEVPLLAIVSELACKHQKIEEDIDVRYSAMTKANKFSQLAPARLIEFGTRRRYSRDVQDIVIQELRRATNFAGTSNVYFAKKYGLKPSGTMPHELFMAQATSSGYCAANLYILSQWAELYQGKLGIALVDTYTTDVFLRSFNGYWARLYDGVRIDSGEPIEIANKIIEHYISLGIDPASKTIVFSDNLNTEKAIEIFLTLFNKWGEDWPKIVFGVGTFLSNDCGASPRNIVIKLDAIKDYFGNLNQTCKLSDTLGKNTGEHSEIIRAMEELGLAKKVMVQ